MRIITEGTSRIVLVFSDFVVKLPWLNISRMVRVFIRDFKSGALNNKVKKRMKHSVFVSYLFLLPHMLGSNRREYLFYKKHKGEMFLMPTKAFLYGNIIVQPRGEVLSSRMQRWKKLYRTMKKIGVQDGELENPRNFSIYNGRIVIHDYGNLETQHFLVSKKFCLT